MNSKKLLRKRGHGFRLEKLDYTLLTDNPDPAKWQEINGKLTAIEIEIVKNLENGHRVYAQGSRTHIVKASGELLTMPSIQKVQQLIFIPKGKNQNPIPVKNLARLASYLQIDVKLLYVQQFPLEIEGYGFLYKEYFI